MKKKNLEKAVILGLLLSTGVYGTAWAETETSESLWGEAGYTTAAGNDLEITNTDDPAAIGPDGTITVDGVLTVNSQTNAIQSGDSKDNTVTILADEVEMDAGYNGIYAALYTEGRDEYPSNVFIGSEDRKIQSLTIEADGQGIKNERAKVYIYGSNDSVFTIHTSLENIKVDENGDVTETQNAAIVNNGFLGEVSLTGGSLNITTDKVEREIQTPGGFWLTATVTGDGIYNSSGTTTLNFNNVIMNVTGSGINNKRGTVSLNTKGTNAIFARYIEGAADQGYGVYANVNSTTDVIASANYDPEIGYSTLKGQEGYDNIIYGKRGGIAGKANIIADNNNKIAGGIAIETTSANIVAGNNNIIGGNAVDNMDNVYTTSSGIKLEDARYANVNIESINGATTIDATDNGIYLDAARNSENNKVSVKAGTDININAGYTGIRVSNSGNRITNEDAMVELIAEKGNNTVTVNVSGNGYGNNYGVYSSKGIAKFDAINNTVGLFKDKKSNEDGAIRTLGGGNVLLEADSTNTILANSNEITTLAKANTYGDKYAINASGKGIVDIKADIANNIIGAVYAKDTETNVNIESLNENADAANYVASATAIDRAGGIDTDNKYDRKTGEENKFYNKQFVSALYAENGATINLTGENIARTGVDSTDEDTLERTLERTVWAYSNSKSTGSTINLTGAVDIRTDNYELSSNSADVAVAAGTATGLEADDVDKFNDANDKRSVVNINYTDTAAGNINYIKGDILAAYAGEVNIKALGENSRAVNNAGIVIEGNLLAGNNGILDVNLGKGGILIGRADDYGDAGVVENSGHGTVENDEGETFYNPAFSSDIYRGGDVTLTMGDGSRWNVQGQSWITNVKTDGNATIDLTSAEKGYESYDSHALTIRNLSGGANIKMNLDGDRSQSDMLYIGQGSGIYNIELEELVTVDDMYAKSADGSFNFSGLRFATVGEGSDVQFNVTVKNKGFNNLRYIVETDIYNSVGENGTQHENNAYNGGETLTEEKPGNELVDDLLNGSRNEGDESGATTAAVNDVMLLDEENETENANNNTPQHLNHKLVDMVSDGFSNAGKAALNMSRANYSNAIYMDRLNKRLGEARYISPEDEQGMWVRIRHDRIGKDDAFRSQNTMYEMGYDVKQEVDNGERRIGMAIDYMDGKAEYSGIAGEGDVKRYGLWLYDTWTGNKGHYVDYVAKWGHLENDFEVYNIGESDKVTGDYSNNVFSVSAEYGKKNDMGNDWYFEPQAQLQLARVTGVDYVTSQGTKVSVDGINSLIGRAGFRIGKDFGEEKQSTLYFKADVLHEFLGDQSISALDETTNGWQTVDYENEGTWYDVGFGFATALSDSSYAFMDFEKSFGNDNDETYQINAGMQWSF